MKAGCLLLAVLATGGLGLMIADAAGVLEAWLRFAGKLLVGWMIHGRALVEAHPVAALAFAAGSALFFLRFGGQFGRWLRVGQWLALLLAGGGAMAVAMLHERTAWQRGVFVDRRSESIFEPDALLIGVAIESFWRKFGRGPASLGELAAATPDFTPGADWFCEPPWNDDPPRRSSPPAAVCTTVGG